MAELDVFEARFAAAYRRYLDEVPTDVDAAAVVRAAATARPRARWAAWRGALRPATALAWPVLVALVIAALVAGLVLVGSQPQRDDPAVVLPVATATFQPAAVTANPLVEHTAKPADPTFVCPPGSTPDEPGRVDQARPSSDISLAMAFDRRAGRVVALAYVDNGRQTWTFDVCTNTWTRMYPNREPPPRTGQLVYDVDSDVTVASDGTRMWAYDYAANTWTEKGVATAWLWAYDPVSGLVVAYGGPDPSVPLSMYDVETDTWTPIHKVNGARPDTGALSLSGWPLVLVYDASVDRIVTSVGAETWLFDIRTGRWSKSGAETPDVIEVFATGPAIVYDEAAERTVLIGDVPRLAAYDATADRWEILAEADPERAAGFQLNAVYDPVNRRLVGWQPRYMHQDDLFAFDLVTREWTVLLAASQPVTPEVLPSPGK